MGVRERGLVGALGLAAAVVALAGGAEPDTRSPSPEGAREIPAFSRLYHTSCTTCHLAPPRLNALGEAFRLAGYRFPENDALLRVQEPVPLGADAWEEEWPRAIWPGEIPATPPLALRVINDVRWTTEETEPSDWTYDFPAEIHLLSAAALGEGVSAFAEIDWDPDREVEVAQAKVRFEIPLGFLPERALHLGVGKQSLRLLSFGDPQLDVIAHEPFLWQTVRTDDLGVPDPAKSVPVGPAPFEPSIEADGIVARRWRYGIGLARGTDADGGDPRDLYWRLAVKLGGLGFDGRYAEDDRPPVAEAGQLYDRAVVLEHFGYLGSAGTRAGVDDDGWTWGAAARWTVGTWDLGAGYVRGARDDPSGSSAPAGDLDWESVFGRAEWFAWPWLVGSLKAETFRAHGPAGEAVGGDRTRVLPGVVALVRPNVRLAAEASLWLEDEPADAARADLPHDLWLRLDVAF